MDNFFLATAARQLLLVISFVVTCASSLEEATPEILLQPRNFNPHPYEVAGRREGTNGPVVFPPNVEETFVQNRNNIVTVGKAGRPRSRHPVDDNPYTRVAKKHRYKVAGRFENPDNQVSDRDYKALAKHGTKVLSYPPEELAQNYSPTNEERRGKEYAFSYKVLDRLTGDDFSHSQTRNSKATNGEYRVKLPDGRVQIVSYTADKNGYKADVKYTEDEEGDATSHHQVQNPQIEQLPVQVYPTANTKSVEFDPNIRPQNGRILVLQAVVPTQIPAHYDNGNVAVSSGPTYLNVIDTHLQSHPQPKVQIYTTNARDHMTGSYIPTTVAPYLSKNLFNHELNISPHITNSGDHGLFVPSTPSSFVVNDQHVPVIDINLISSTPSSLLGEGYATSSTPASYVLSRRHRSRSSSIAQLLLH